METIVQIARRSQDILRQGNSLNAILIKME